MSRFAALLRLGKMPEIEINGVIVKFPLVPDTIQRDFIFNVITCLDKSENVTLKSPAGSMKRYTFSSQKTWFSMSLHHIFVGTGTTLCLLSATLAWMEQTKAPTPPTVIYTCKTRSQIAKGICKTVDECYRFCFGFVCCAA